MLIGGQQLSAVLSRMVAVIRFHKTVVGQLAFLAVLQELVVGGEYLGLVLEQVDDFLRRTGRIEIVELGGAAGRQVGGQDFLDALLALAGSGTFVPHDALPR